ncbi:MAG TPA: DUF58 domain-containing protein [Jiangellales bacterium]|nr:DUF58 domain-containing protein [Jiangellales bacterium]
MRRVLAGLTGRGVAFLVAGLLAGLVAVLLGQRDLLRVSVLLVVLPLVALAVVLRSRVRLAAARTLDPARVPVGQPATVRLALQNLARIPTGVLLVEDTLPYVLGTRPRFVLDHVWSRFRREVRYTVRADVRGRYDIGPLTVRLTDPFGLVEVRRAFSERAALVVTPHVVPLPPVRLPGEWSGSGESRPRSAAAAGEEDATIRSYRHGDDMRRVHWRATAHHGELMVRREEQPWQSRATLLLDTRSRGHTGHGPTSSFEWAVTATASAAAHLLGRGYAVRLLTDSGGAVSSEWHDPGEGPGSAEGVVLDALAVVNPLQQASVGRWPDLLTGAGSATGLLVAVLGRLHADEAAVVAGLRHGSTAALAVLLDVTTWTSLPERARAEEALHLERATTTLRRAGWRVVVAGRQDPLPVVWERLALGAALAGSPVGSPAGSPVGSPMGGAA